MLIEIFRFLHLLGLAFGLGGATIATMISNKADKDREIGSVAMKIVPSISKLIWFGFFLLIISGIGISFYMKGPINKQLLIIKHVLVAWIFILGIVIGTRIRKMSKLAPLNSKGKISSEFLKIKKQLKFFSTLNLILWYLVTLLSVFI